jgi:hypothetical protein
MNCYIITAMNYFGRTLQLPVRARSLPNALANYGKREEYRRQDFSRIQSCKLANY